MADELLSGIFLSRRCLIRRWGLSVGSPILLLCAILSALIFADAIRVSAAGVDQIKKESSIVFYNSMTAEHHEALVKGVKLHPVQFEVAKNFEAMSKLYYEIVR